MDLPLQGTKVVELAGGVPAAYCGHLLAGYGAEVTLVERHGPPGAGEGAGTERPAAWRLTEDEATYLDPGKQRVTLDAAGARGPDGTHTALDELVAGADIVVLDGPPGGVDVPAWRAAHPSLVVVSVSPFGWTGPDRDLPADDLICFAAGGIMSLTGDPASTPLLTGGSQALWYSGLHAFSAAVSLRLGAVLHGSGDWADLSIQECCAGSLELYGPASAMGEPPALRFGNYHRATWALYPTAEGYGGVFCLERQIPSLFALIGEPALDEERFRDPLQRAEHDEELSAYVVSFMVQQTGDELIRLGARHRIPFGMVRTPTDLLGSASLHERGYFDTVPGPDGDELQVPGRPFPGLGWQGGTAAEVRA